MHPIQSLFQRRIRGEVGASTVEYTIVVVGLSLVAAAAIASFDLNAFFDAVETLITRLISGTTSPAGQ
jgi:Flp pilus assembly pilin Flp